MYLILCVSVGGCVYSIALNSLPAIDEDKGKHNFFMLCQRIAQHYRHNFSYLNILRNRKLVETSDNLINAPAQTIKYKNKFSFHHKTKLYGILCLQE